MCGIEQAVQRPERSDFPWNFSAVYGVVELLSVGNPA